LGGSFSEKKIHSLISYRPAASRRDNDAPIGALLLAKQEAWRTMMGSFPLATVGMEPQAMRYVFFSLSLELFGVFI
jgi:hypothetical protein